MASLTAPCGGEVVNWSAHDCKVAGLMRDALQVSSGEPPILNYLCLGSQTNNSMNSQHGASKTIASFNLHSPRTKHFKEAMFL